MIWWFEHLTSDLQIFDWLKIKTSHGRASPTVRSMHFPSWIVRDRSSRFWFIIDGPKLAKHHHSRPIQERFKWMKDIGLGYYGFWLGRGMAPWLFQAHWCKDRPCYCEWEVVFPLWFSMPLLPRKTKRNFFPFFFFFWVNKEKFLRK